MAYVVLARKYRPFRFDEFVGQQAIAVTLRNAITANRVHHAYLFCGPRGVGKTSMARVFAMALNCERNPGKGDPCGECGSCRAIQTGEDIDVLELDGASNRGINEIREIRANARYATARSRHKIYYIDEAHMLTTEAFNALLKTLEEPPAHVKFILSTTDPSKMPETIHSRCQRFDFRRITVFDVAERLERICANEHIAAGRDALLRIGRQAAGSMRDALSLLDQMVAFSGNQITLESLNQALGAAPEGAIAALVEELRSGDAGAALRRGGELLDAGREVSDILDQAAIHLRDLLVAGQCGADTALLEQPADIAAQLVERSRVFSPEALMHMIQVIAEARRRARGELDPRILLEITLVKLSRIADLRALDELAARLEALEQRLGGATPEAAPSTRPPPANPGPARRPYAESRRPAPPLEDYNDAPDPAALERAPTPKRVPGAPPEAEPADSEDTTSAVWKRVLAMLQEEKKKTMLSAHVAANCAYLGENDGVVGIRLQGGSFMEKEIRSAESQKLLEECFSAVLGREARISFIAGAASGHSKAADDPTVRKALEAFNGRIIAEEE